MTLHQIAHENKLLTALPLNCKTPSVRPNPTRASNSALIEDCQRLYFFALSMGPRFE